MKLMFIPQVRSLFLPWFLSFSLSLSACQDPSSHHAKSLPINQLPVASETLHQLPESPNGSRWNPSTPQNHEDHEDHGVQREHPRLIPTAIPMTEHWQNCSWQRQHWETWPIAVTQLLHWRFWSKNTYWFQMAQISQMMTFKTVGVRTFRLHPTLECALSTMALTVQNLRDCSDIFNVKLCL